MQKPWKSASYWLDHLPAFSYNAESLAQGWHNPQEAEPFLINHKLRYTLQANLMEALSHLMLPPFRLTQPVTN